MLSSQAGQLTLASIAPDLQIIICTFLRPSDILALRKTCKAFQFCTKQREVWIAALHQVCLDNTLFLPGFPILDMSDMELERAAMGPRRWIELCTAGAKQSCAPRTTRIIEDPLATVQFSSSLFIVPGGRYLVRYSSHGVCVWDLGYASNADCKLIASVELEPGCYWSMAHPTPDGMGLILFSSSLDHCTIHEIYPQSITPQLTQIAYLDLNPFHSNTRAHLLPDRVVWYNYYDQDGIVFRVWDYRLNHSISFFADIDVEKFDYSFSVIATNTALIVLCPREILVWGIPPLSPQPPNFFHYSLTPVPPLFSTTYPDDIARQTEVISWKPISSWYFGSSQPVYFDVLCGHDISVLHRLEVIVEPDLSATSLRSINTFELTPRDYVDIDPEPYSICDDALVCCYDSTTSKSSRVAKIISHGGVTAKMLLPTGSRQIPSTLCPASGRFAYADSSGVNVVDFF